jgi:hypothetical protein
MRLDISALQLDDIGRNQPGSDSLMCIPPFTEATMITTMLEPYLRYVKSDIGSNRCSR